MHTNTHTDRQTDTQTHTHTYARVHTHTLPVRNSKLIFDRKTRVLNECYRLIKVRAFPESSLGRDKGEQKFALPKLYALKASFLDNPELDKKRQQELQDLIFLPGPDAEDAGGGGTEDQGPQLQSESET